MAKSHIQLRRRYNYYNRKYFDGKLPTDIEIIWAPCDDANGKVDWIGNKPIIKIDPSLQGQPKFTNIILLHEVAHVSHPRAHHGKVFKDEIKRLIDAGAYDGLL